MFTIDPTTHPAPVPSPCTGICQMDAATGWCKGCLRTLDEICDWGLASEAKKRAIWQSILARRVGS